MFNRLTEYRDKTVYPTRYLKTIVALYQPWYENGADMYLSRGERSEYDCARAVLAERKPGRNKRVQIMKAFQHIKAPNDVNGNPRRLFMVYDGDDFYAIDEGYSGKPSFLRDYFEMVPMTVAPCQYRALLREDTRS